MAQKKGSSNKTMPKLDLHGYKSDEVYDAIDLFLRKNAHKARVNIIPGKGSGIVKKLTLEYLKQAGYPWEYEALSNGNKNTGSLIIFLD